MYDLIGDIHGHADELVALLAVLGYQKSRGAYRHPERRVIFLGDFIDRGPKIRQVLEIVRPMVEEDAARAVLGNHELNALAYHTEDPESPGDYMRRRNDKNKKQHDQTLKQLGPEEQEFYLDWFRTLPLYLDIEGLRAVHACWDEQAISRICEAWEPHRRLTNSLLQAACTAGGPLFGPVEVALKGKEAKLPPGISFRDKDGHVRTHTRLRWYQSPHGQTYRSYALTDRIDCDLPLSEDALTHACPYAATEKPVFVGHYWLSAQRPEILAENVACLDYSVAKDGFLCAYRWHGEQKLRNEHFVSVAGGAAR